MIPTQIYVCGEVLDRKERFDRNGRPMVNLMIQAEARTSKATYTITASGKSIEDVSDVNVGDIILVNGRFEPMHGNGSFDSESYKFLNVFAEGCSIMQKAHDNYDRLDVQYTEPVQEHPRFCNYGEDDVEYMARPDQPRRW